LYRSTYINNVAAGICSLYPPKLSIDFRSGPDQIASSDL
jgi:hypothetical protein